MADAAPAFGQATLATVLQTLSLVDAPPPTLATLPTVLLGEVVRWLPAPLDVAHLDCTSRLFHLGAPRSAVEEGLRLRAEAAGRAVATALPAGETSWSQSLLWEERRLLACAPPVVSSGHGYRAFVDPGGQLLTCGQDHQYVGVLGQNTAAYVTTPRAVAGLGGVRIRTVSAGGFHTLACSDEGVAYSFGCGCEGRLGHGHTEDEHTPRVIDALQGVHVSAVAASRLHSLALSSAGALYSFGRATEGQLGHGDEVDQHTPRRVVALNGSRVSAAAAGGYHSLALTEAGSVYSFGLGAHGRLGHDNRASKYTPQFIAALQGVCVGSVAAGKLHSLAVSTAGELY